MTTLELLKAACGIEDGLPTVTFYEPNIRDFKKVLTKFWSTNVYNRKVINDNAITPLHLFIEDGMEFARSYWMQQFTSPVKKLGCFDFLAEQNYFPGNYTVAKIRDYASREQLLFVIQCVRKMYTPMSDYGSTKVYLPLPVRCTPYNLGFYGDNRDTMTTIVLHNRLLSGRIPNNALRHGIPYRHNVRTHILRTFLPNYPTLSIDSLECIAIQPVMYSMTVGALGNNAGPNIVGPPVIPSWDIGYCPPAYAAWNETTTGLVNGIPNQEYPDLADGQANIRPWHLPGSFFFEIFRIITPVARQWPPFSPGEDDFRTIDFMARFPDIQPQGIGVQLVAPQPVPNPVTHAIDWNPIDPDLPATMVSLYYTSNDIDPKLYRAEVILPTVSLFRPNGQDAAPPRFVVNFPQNQTVGIRGGFDGTWALWDATDISLRLVKEDVRTFSRKTAVNQFVHNQSANYSVDEFPSLATPLKAPPRSFGPKPKQSARKKRAQNQRRSKAKRAPRLNDKDEKSNVTKEKLSDTQVYAHPKPTKEIVEKKT